MAQHPDMVCVCVCAWCVCMHGVCVCMHGVCVCMHGVCVCAWCVCVCVNMNNEQRKKKVAASQEDQNPAPNLCHIQLVTMAVSELNNRVHTDGFTLAVINLSLCFKQLPNTTI